MAEKVSPKGENECQEFRFAPSGRRNLHDTLVRWHMRPLCVASGVEALRAMDEAATRNAAFSLVLLDAMMPSLLAISIALERS